MPSKEYKDRAIDFISELYQNNSEINGTGGLDRYLRESTYEDWLDNLNSDKGEDNPTLTYFCEGRGRENYWNG